VNTTWCSRISSSIVSLNIPTYRKVFFFIFLVNCVNSSSLLNYAISDRYTSCISQTIYSPSEGRQGVFQITFRYPLKGVPAITSVNRKKSSRGSSSQFSLCSALCRFPNTVPGSVYRDLRRISSTEDSFGKVVESIPLSFA